MQNSNRSGGPRKNNRTGKDGSGFKREGGSSRFKSDRPFNREKKSSEGDSADSEKKSYKQKRSFTRNKDYRSKQGDGFKKDFSESKGDKVHKRPFSRDYGSDKFEKKKTYGKDREGFKKDFDGDKKRKFDDKDKPFKRSFSRDDDRPKKDYSGDKKRSFGDRDNDRPKRNFDSDRKRSFSERDGDYKKPFDKDREEKPFRKKEYDGEKRSYGDREKKPFDGEKKSYGDGEKKPRFKKPFRKEFESDDKRGSFRGRDEEKRSYSKNDKKEKYGEKRLKYDELEEGQGFKGSYDKSHKRYDKPESRKVKVDDGTTRLNKYLAHSGIASRREADNLIKSGTVKVNGVVITEMGYKIKDGDKVTYGDSAVKNERKMYLLLNKPKDYITTMDDPQESKTVLELIAGACRERVYPVGRLDRNTTGLLLLTNDGEMTKKLTHPKYGIKKLYHVSLNKGLKPEDFKSIIDGVELEDGMIAADDLAFVGEGKKEIGIEIHSGRNRIVRRLFEHLGYEVLKLDRVAFAGLTKKDIPRGKYRFLTQKEVNFLKMIG